MSCGCNNYYQNLPPCDYSCDCGCGCSGGQSFITTTTTTVNPLTEGCEEYYLDECIIYNGIVDTTTTIQGGGGSGGSSSGGSSSSTSTITNIFECYGINISTTTDTVTLNELIEYLLSLLPACQTTTTSTLSPSTTSTTAAPTTTTTTYNCPGVEINLFSVDGQDISGACTGYDPGLLATYYTSPECLNNLFTGSCALYVDCELTIPAPSGFTYSNGSQYFFVQAGTGIIILWGNCGETTTTTTVEPTTTTTTIQPSTTTTTSGPTTTTTEGPTTTTLEPTTTTTIEPPTTTSSTTSTSSTSTSTTSSSTTTTTESGVPTTTAIPCNCITFTNGCGSTQTANNAYTDCNGVVQSVTISANSFVEVCGHSPNNGSNSCIAFTTGPACIDILGTPTCNCCTGNGQMTLEVNTGNPGDIQFTDIFTTNLGSGWYSGITLPIDDQVGTITTDVINDTLFTRITNSLTNDVYLHLQFDCLEIGCCLIPAGAVDYECQFNNFSISQGDCLNLVIDTNDCKFCCNSGEIITDVTGVSLEITGITIGGTDTWYSGITYPSNVGTGTQIGTITNLSGFGQLVVTVNNGGVTPGRLTLYQNCVQIKCCTVPVGTTGYTCTIDNYILDPEKNMCFRAVFEDGSC